MLQLFVDEPERERFGLEIIKQAGIPSGSLYPILHRLEERGLLLASWEEMATAVEQRRRPRRRYRLDADRRAVARELLAEARADQRQSSASPRLRPRGAST